MLTTVVVDATATSRTGSLLYCARNRASGLWFVPSSKLIGQLAFGQNLTRYHPVRRVESINRLQVTKAHTLFRRGIHRWVRANTVFEPVALYEYVTNLVDISSSRAASQTLL
ncbi:hypothetical protein EVAR_69798_1 [Eumeta japonica]|uniref:Uncharacterized protein n=1 Tax=Eumeta variegata TaxID=151549 RepID=A0A4C1SBT0_EUMVA|nr:hypothetical protein EVAR_69798_1 [Eumeta japonica]